MSQENLVSFRVYGRAASQGSKRAVRTKSGKVVVIEDNPRTYEWRQEVASVAHRAYSGPLHLGPVGLRLIFVRARPKSHYGTGRNVNRLRQTAPSYALGKPDLLKLGRAIEDALTGVIFRDDSQVVSLTLGKVWGEENSVHVTVQLFDAANSC